MTIKAAFDNPVSISQSTEGPDQFVVKLRYPSMFVSKQTGVTLADTYEDQNEGRSLISQLVGNIPKQLPIGVKQKQL